MSGSSFSIPQRDALNSVTSPASEQDFEITLPDDHQAFGFERTGLLTAPVIMLRPRLNGRPGYWRPDGYIAYVDPSTDVQRAMKRSNEAFLDALRPLGFSAKDVWYFNGEDAISERVTDYTWPRRLRWNDLPVVGQAQRTVDGLMGLYCLSGDHPKLNTEDYNAPLLRHTVLAALSSAQVVILDHPHPDGQDLAEFGNLLQGGGTSAPLLLWFDGAQMRPLDPVEVELARSEWACHERFMWSHILNARILCARAMADSLDSTSQEHLDRKRKEILSSGTFMNQRWSPYTLQVLFHLAKRGEAGCVIPPSYDGTLPRMMHPDTGDDYKAKIAVAAGLAVIHGEQIQWVWHGTGTYAPYLGPLLDINRGISFAELLQQKKPKPKLGAVRRTGDEAYCLQQLWLADMVAMEPDRIKVTEAGHRFLDLIGPEADDPDVLLRWRKPDGRLGGLDDVPAMDRWLNRVFRSIKRRVSGLPRVVPSADTETIWNKKGSYPAGREPAERDKRALIFVMGRVLSFRLEDFTKPGFPVAEVVAAMAASKEGRAHPVEISQAGNGYYLLWAGVTCPLEMTEAEQEAFTTKAKDAVANMPAALAAWPDTFKFELTPLAVLSK